MLKLVLHETSRKIVHDNKKMAWKNRQLADTMVRFVPLETKTMSTAHNATLVDGINPTVMVPSGKS